MSRSNVLISQKADSLSAFSFAFRRQVHDFHPRICEALFRFESETDRGAFCCHRDWRAEQNRAPLLRKEHARAERPELDGRWNLHAS
ncbi:MAG TPA: hypothetical protein VHD14_05145 [Pseudolabrys sp.]|nr:hypothetical protein [Pseudolabrys sp.]